jgi:roadblock/LC7 domain-containing protein
MSEVYPSDNELLNILADEETGVEYITTGKSPYYLEFRKLLYRLLLATKRANSLRVFDEGGLNIGVKSGKFWAGTALVEYGGSSGNTMADDKANIYVYLNAAGNLVTNEYSQFPNMASTPHLRLAIIATSGGDIVSITDARCNYYVPSGV